MVIRDSNNAKGFWRPRILPGTFVWTPPPAAAAVAIEELRKARIKRQQLLNVVVIPMLNLRLRAIELNQVLTNLWVRVICFVCNDERNAGLWVECVGSPVRAMGVVPDSGFPCGERY